MTIPRVRQRLSGAQIAIEKRVVDVVIHSYLYWKDPNRARRTEARIDRAMCWIQFAVASFIAVCLFQVALIYGQNRSLQEQIYSNTQRIEQVQRDNASLDTKVGILTTAVIELQKNDALRAWELNMYRWGFVLVFGASVTQFIASFVSVILRRVVKDGA